MPSMVHEKGGRAALQKATRTCLRCGYTWIARIASPKSCPECKHRKWQQKRKALTA